MFNKTNAWVQYNSVDFGKKPLKSVTIRATSGTGATIQLRTGSIDGPIISEIKIPKSSQWSLTTVKLLKFEPGVQNIFVIMKGDGNVQADWITFK